MVKDSFILNLYKSSKTVFSTKDIAIFNNETNLNNLKSKINYYVKNNSLLRLKNGIFSKEKYSPEEFTTKLYSPSYISLETALAKEGVIFQYYSTIFCISYLSREIEVNGIKIKYYKIKESILLNKEGLVFENNYWRAGIERAFLDKLYFNADAYFDNLNKIDWDYCFELVKIYENKRLEKTLNKYYKLYADK